MIGITVVVLTGLCAGGLLLFYLLPARGQHRKPQGRHRDDGPAHEGAGSEGHAEELELLVDVVQRHRDKRDRLGGS
jgi:hypothetical protein